MEDFRESTSWATDEYLMKPSNDKVEKERLDLQHRIMTMTLGGRLQVSEFVEDPQRVLDVGCGTGAWALAFAQAHPNSMVTAVDLTPPPESCTDRVVFLQKNMEETWDFDEQFDFIHCRMLAAGIRDWQSLLAKCSLNLIPGGTIEIHDICHPFRAELEGFDANESSFIRWGASVEEMFRARGLDYRAAEKQAQRLEAVGFTNIKEQEILTPFQAWDPARHDPLLSKLQFENFTTFLQNYGADLLAGHEALSAVEASSLTDQAIGDVLENSARNRKIQSAQRPIDDNVH